MSPSTRVVTGLDDRGRPKAEWRPIGDGQGSTPAYGFMEPAYDATAIERRKATPEELAAARAREAEPSHLTVDTSRTLPVGALTSRPVGPTDAERLQASRQRGAERHVEVVMRRRPDPELVPPPEEEPPVSEAPTESPANIPETIPSPEPDPVAVTQLDQLAAAAGRARIAREEKEAADTAWDVAREALARAYGLVEWIVEPLPPQPDDDHAHQVMTIEVPPRPPRVRIENLDGEGRPMTTEQAIASLTVPRVEVAPEPIGGGPVRSRSGEGQRAGQASARDRRALAVMSAMERLGDDMGAVATELGMKKNAVAQVVKFARRRTAAEATRAAKAG